MLEMDIKILEHVQMEVVVEVEKLETAETEKLRSAILAEEAEKAEEIDDKYSKKKSYRIFL